MTPLREIAKRLVAPLMSGDGVTAWRVCRVCRGMASGDVKASAHLGDCGVLFLEDAIDAALREVQATERARCASVARNSFVGSAVPGAEVGQLIAEAIEAEAQG